MTKLLPQDFDVIKPFLDKVSVDVIPITNKLGINVFSVPMELGVSGQLIKNEKIANIKPSTSGWTILVNSDEGSKRQRFTIAHELGHFMLHKESAEKTGIISDDTYYRSNQLSDYKESEANRFAANLLMPWSLIEAHMKRPDILTVGDIAKAFDVSEIAMSIRLGVDA